MMGGDLIAWVVGITLGVAVIVVGLRRELDGVTRSWLPEFEKGTATAEKGTAMAALGGGGRGRRPLPPGQRRLAVAIYALVSVANIAEVVLSADDRLLHAITAVTFGIGAVVFTLRREKGAEVPAP